MYLWMDGWVIGVIASAPAPRVMWNDPESRCQTFSLVN